MALARLPCAWVFGILGILPTVLQGSSRGPRDSSKKQQSQHLVAFSNC